MADYMHGVETIDSPGSTSPVQEIRTGVIAIVGTAPAGAVNSMVLVKNPADAAQFGQEVPGFTIRQALEDAFGEGAGYCVVINVFDLATMTTAVAAELVVMSNGKGKTAFPPLSNIVVKNQAGATTYVRGTDYTIDEYGNIVSLKYDQIAAGATVSVSYNKQNTASVTATQIIGTIDVNGVRTGLKLLEESYNTFGFEPKILITPGFSHLAAVDAELQYWTKRLKAIAYVDAPPASSISVVQAGRTPAGVINFNLYDKDVTLCFPELLSFNPATGGLTAKPYSQFAAGIRARVDRENDIHYSISNKPFRRAKGVATKISGSFFNSDNDANLLNSLGILTVMNEGTSALSTWGNHNSLFPSSAGPLSFEATNRAISLALRSIQLASKQFLDLPIEQWVLDAIRDNANSYIRALIGRGVLVKGSECIFDKDKNPDSEVAQGHLVYTLKWMSPLPLEKITYYSDVDIQLFTNSVLAQQ